MKGRCGEISKKGVPPKDAYDRIIDELGKLSRKIDSLTHSTETILEAEEKILSTLGKRVLLESQAKTVVPDATALLSLPGSLRKTILAMYKLGEATAEDLSDETSRLRAVESACANQLTRMGYLEKKRIGRKVYFQMQQSLGALVE